MFTRYGLNFESKLNFILILCTISTYQTTGKFGTKLSHRPALTQLKKTFSNPSNTAKVVHNLTILLNHHVC